MDEETLLAVAAELEALVRRAGRTAFEAGISAGCAGKLDITDADYRTWNACEDRARRLAYFVRWGDPVVPYAAPMW